MQERCYGKVGITRSCYGGKHDGNSGLKLERLKNFPIMLSGTTLNSEIEKSRQN